MRRGAIGVAVTRSREYFWTLCACGREFACSGKSDSKKMRREKAREERHFATCRDAIAYAANQETDAKPHAC